MDACDLYHVEPSTAHRVARAYLEHPTGCYPVNRVMAEELGMSVRQLQRSRHVLRDTGLVAL